MTDPQDWLRGRVISDTLTLRTDVDCDGVRTDPETEEPCVSYVNGDKDPISKEDAHAMFLASMT